MVLRSQQAFWRDLPELLKDERNHGKWVAYHGERAGGHHGGRRSKPIRNAFAGG